MRVKLTINLGTGIATPSHSEGDVFDIDEAMGGWLLAKHYAIRLPDEIQAVPPPPVIAEKKQPEPAKMNEPENNESVIAATKTIKDYRQQSAQKQPYPKER